MKLTINTRSGKVLFSELNLKSTDAKVDELMHEIARLKPLYNVNRQRKYQAFDIRTNIFIKQKNSSGFVRARLASECIWD
jgi:hypothetical protein